MALDLSPGTTDELSKLVLAYNAKAPSWRHITDADFTVTGPFAAPPLGQIRSGKNASVRAEPKAARADLRGRINIFYDRVVLDALSVSPLGWDETITSMHQLLPMINSAYGLNILEADVDDEPVTTSSMSLTVNSTSVRYTGTLTFGPNTISDLADAIVITELDGFTL